MKTLNEAALGTRFTERMAAGKPFSFVRLGDGEATLLRYPEYESLENAQAQVRRWWHDPVSDHDTILTIRAAMLRAFQNADMLGVPHDDEQLKYPKWNIGLRFDQFMDYLGLPGRRDAEPFYFYHLVNLNNSGILAAACSGKRLRLITCRPAVGVYIAEKFRPEALQTHVVRAETFRWRPYSQIDEAAEASAGAPSHWPDGYQGALDWIEHGGANWVYLIGAGGLGKVYADAAKRTGCVGLDIGALFDGWLGLPTRPYVEGLKL